MNYFRDRFFVLLIALAGYLVIGTMGFVIFSGADSWSAFYISTTILLTHFYHLVPEPLPTQILIVFLIISSYVILLYIAQVFIDALFGGKIKENVERRKMENKIAELKEHYIVCGQGRVGREVAQELAEEGVPFVVLDRNPAELELAQEKGWLNINKDSTEEEALKEAGIDKAKVMISALGEDADNVFATLTARSLNPDVTIIARANETSTEPKLLRAGANRVSVPHLMGGFYMATTALHPTATNFCDVVMDTKHQELNIEGIKVEESSLLVGKKLGDVLNKQTAGVNVLAINRQGSTNINPPDDFVINTDDQLIIMGAKGKLLDIMNMTEATK